MAWKSHLGHSVDQWKRAPANVESACSLTGEAVILSEPVCDISICFLWVHLLPAGPWDLNFSVLEPPVGQCQGLLHNVLYKPPMEAPSLNRTAGDPPRIEAPKPHGNYMT